jgi:hypothetical protein
MGWWVDGMGGLDALITLIPAVVFNIALRTASMTFCSIWRRSAMSCLSCLSCFNVGQTSQRVRVNTRRPRWCWLALFITLSYPILLLIILPPSSFLLSFLPLAHPSIHSPTHPPCNNN